MNIKCFFPFPVKHQGLFGQRYDLINLYRKQQNPQHIFRSHLPDIASAHNYFSYIKKNSFSKDYFGSILTDDDAWKLNGALADLDNFYKGITDTLDTLNPIYFMTNTAGHHTDNHHYELFCPINQLFFITEVLNYTDNFPSVYWVDLDAHFGNGDKSMFDEYKKKMANESVNLSGISFHNDGPIIEESGYGGVNYSREISNNDFLQLVNDRITIPFKTKYCLIFLGTDIINSDYGDNKNITIDILKPLLGLLRDKAHQSQSRLFLIQTGGTQGSIISELINTIQNIEI